MWLDIQNILGCLEYTENFVKQAINNTDCDKQENND